MSKDLKPALLEKYAGTPISDEYIAKLLMQDAAKFNSNFSRFGSGSALFSERKKPDTQFMKNVLQHTVGHNKSLLQQEESRKEEEERQRRREKRRRVIEDTPPSHRELIEDEDDGIIGPHPAGKRVPAPPNRKKKRGRGNIGSNALDQYFGTSVDPQDASDDEGERWTQREVQRSPDMKRKREKKEKKDKKEKKKKDKKEKREKKEKR
ncbi:hypothetical protein PROFUN_02177 [Planoprotostelium fungivorum]|uniref:Uncharacterized protein n=1 Tax=Planoprotostelium fungivorum TaxID=1890364 RepID=A0A2P6NZB3_9EUKA|nr:hypothetical protein PROFUN_02177 [Planoprotostelium fungivorum]